MIQSVPVFLRTTKAQQQLIILFSLLSMFFGY
jgi:hypothetical protein